MDYSRLAPYYQCIENCTMGSVLQRARTWQLEHLPNFSAHDRVLIVGEGDGRFLEAFLTRFGQTKITVVEPSEGMISQALKRLISGGFDLNDITWVSEPLLEADLEMQSFDLIVSLFFFDNFEDATVRKSMAFLESKAKASANWLLADFRLPEKGWSRLRAKLWIGVLYRFFGMATGVRTRTMPDLEKFMQETRFQEHDRKLLCGRILFSSVYQARD